MLFNSYEFIFLFLPVVFGVFFMLGRGSSYLAAAWLTLSSIFFYGWWNPVYVWLLLASIVFNFIVGSLISRSVAAQQRLRSRILLTIGVSVNLVLIAYFKYWNFFVGNISLMFGAVSHLSEIILPLGISFFTFTQIAYLADTYQGKVREYRFVHYALFVTYFPHLIAGPVLHHKEMMPQFALSENYRINWENIAVGLTIFFIGLFKKTVIADGIAGYVAPVFDAPAGGGVLTVLDAWGGALAYTFQLYFDFSGYSDMAIGLSRLFGVRLPLNFHSPYKAASVIEFWRCWHMTLSRFLRDYLYIPLGGNRNGVARRYLNLMVTMVLGGLWHGASWTFVVWGGLHGFYLLVNHAWRGLRARLTFLPRAGTWYGRAAARCLTFFAVVAGWVFFRAASVDVALSVLQGMLGLNGVVMPYRWLEKLGAAGPWLAAHGVSFRDLPAFSGGLLNWIVILLLVVWFCPNTQQIMSAYRPVLVMPKNWVAVGNRWWIWRPNAGWLIALIMLASYAILSLTEFSEFIYFRF